jgi:hypothetical protein
MHDLMPAFHALLGNPIVSQGAAMAALLAALVRNFFPFSPGGSVPVVNG